MATLTSIAYVWMMVTLALMMLFLLRSYRELGLHRYQRHRAANIAVRLMGAGRAWTQTILLTCSVLFWFLDMRSCASYLATYYGFAPLQVGDGWGGTELDCMVCGVPLLAEDLMHPILKLLCDQTQCICSTTTPTKQTLQLLLAAQVVSATITDMPVPWKLEDCALHVWLQSAAWVEVLLLGWRGLILRK